MKILICSDGSSQAENAVRFGGVIAVACQAEITLLGIIEEPFFEENLYAALRRSQQILREKNLSVELITRSGEPVSEIFKQAGQSAYDLVVIGAVRKGTQGAYWMSAKAYDLIKGIELPLLVVIGHPQELHRILICTGGGAYVNKAIQIAGRIARCIQAQVRLVHVSPQAPALYADLMARLEDVDALLKSRSALGRNLRHQKNMLEAQGLKTEVILRQGPVVWQLLDEMQEGGYEMVVVGYIPTQGPFRSYLMGDITRELVNHSECPILVVPGSAGPRAGGILASLRRIFAGSPDETQKKP
jgi:nucleotide-binding universal stress UspA family protein